MKTIHMLAMLAVSIAGAAVAQTPSSTTTTTTMTAPAPAPAPAVKTVHRVVHRHTSYTRHRVVTHTPSRGSVAVRHVAIKKTVKTPTGTHVETETKTSTTPRQ